MGNSQLKRSYGSIVKQYGLHAHRINPCHSLYKKTAAYSVSTSKGKYFLKPYHGRKSRLKRVYSQMVWLQKHHFHHMPKWFKTKKGKHYVNSKGRLYYVSEWIQGSKLNDNVQDYEKLGEVLGQLHFVSRSSAVSAPSFSARKITCFQQQHKTFVRQLPIIRKQRNEIGKWFKKNGKQCVALGQEAWSTLLQPDIRRSIRQEKPSIIHGDVTWPNVIVGSNVVYLVDWEFSRRGSAYYEVAKTLNNIANFDLLRIQAFLAGYEKHNSLTAKERLIISSLFRLPREAWMTARKIRSDRKPSIFYNLKNSWPKRMETIQWMDLWATQQTKEP